MSDFFFKGGQDKLKSVIFGGLNIHIKLKLADEHFKQLSCCAPVTLLPNSCVFSVLPPDY